MPATILIIEDSPEIRLSARFILEDSGYLVLECSDPFEAQALLETDQTVSLILLDMNFSRDTTSGNEGMAFLQYVQKKQLAIPVIAMTAWSSVDLAVRAMQQGACDFIEKPWQNQRLLKLLQQQLTLNDLTKKNKKLQQQLNDHPSQPFIYNSTAMQQLIEQLEKVAKTDANILLTGENGTGKSQLAQWIHLQSARKTQPFIAVNMGAIVESLFESEMFGHKKGAFTDAKSERIGRFELAENGSLFLDEIANIPLPQQAKLLRVLESQEYEMVGASYTKKANVRLISATNGDFSRLIATSAFREDLYYRLNTLEFVIPPLRERVEDIIPLCEHFISHHAKKYNHNLIKLTDCAKLALLHYSWPGNVRELSHIIERAVLLATTDTLSASHLNLNSNQANNTLPLMTLESAERQLIDLALKQTQGHIPNAAKLLGLGKSSMYRRLEKYGITV
ncbi:sigma-54 dependent transcriptional regulator [Pseudoalteromonas issachenkonii]|uniref:Sigma-54 dependent transcriptional regulator n=1 Tax=Pseudoalteromonas issachenkonii TaxID=152297 RepID=A0ABU9H0Q8_9GAMM